MQSKKSNTAVDKFNQEVSDFFGIPEIKVRIIPINSRAEYDELRGQKTKDWMVGFTRGKTVYILDKDKFETDSSHPGSDFEPVLKHEIAHIYYRQLKKNGGPAWLNEGTACFVAGQNKKPPQEAVTIETLEQYHDHGGEGIYSIGRYMVNQIMENYGKEKLFELIEIDNR